MDTDGDLDFDDIGGFLALLANGGALELVPEPSTTALAALALIGLALCRYRRPAVCRRTSGSKGARFLTGR